MVSDGFFEGEPDEVGCECELPAAYVNFQGDLIGLHTHLLGQPTKLGPTPYPIDSEVCSVLFQVMRDATKARQR